MKKGMPVEQVVPIFGKEDIPWDLLTIGDICDTVQKVNPKEKPDEGFNYIDISGIDNERFMVAETKAYYGNNAPSRARQLVRAGDIVFSTVRTYLKNMARITRELDGEIASTGFCVLRPKEPEYSGYLYYYLQYEPFLNELAKFQRGTSYPAVRDGDVYAQFIPVPPKHEVVSRLDEAVAGLKRVKANLKRYKAAVLKAAVEGHLVETEAEVARREGRSYETGEQLLKRILETRRSQWKGKSKYKEPVAPDTTDLPELPEGWVWAAVQQIAEVASGNTPAGILKAVKPVGEVPWFKVGDMNHDQNQQVMRYADSWPSLAEVKDLGLRIFQPSTILFPKRGGAIATNKKRRLESLGCADLNTMGITPVDEIARYFFAWFEGVNLTGLSDGSNVPQINHKDIEPLVVPFPPQGEQHRIVAEVDRRLSLVQEVEALVDANMKRAERLRQAVLSKAFAGKLIH